MGTILQEFRKGNRILIKYKIELSGSGHFCEINCEQFRKCLCFVSRIFLLNMLDLNREKTKNTILSEKIFGKFVFHENKKMDRLK